MTVYINLMQPHLNTEVISLLVLVCPPPPVSRTSIILLHVLQCNHWISTCTLSENVFFKNCLISGFFFSHTWVQEKDVGFFFYSLVFLFNQKGKWSIGTRCNILFFFLNQIFHHVWNYSHFSVYFGVVNEYLMYCMFSFVKVIKSGPQIFVLSKNKKKKT